MAKNRRPDVHFTDEIITAFKAADYMALHRALGLTPWNHSPLPDAIEGLGVNQGPPPDYMDQFQRADWRRAQALQRELLAIVGWPKCRAAYEANLKEAVEWAEYCQQELIECSHQGTGSDLASRRRNLQEAEDDVVYRRGLLDGLDRKVQQLKA